MYVTSTGGTGGLGLLTANWLQAAGSSPLLLLGRTGRIVSDGLCSLSNAHRLVQVSRADVTRAEEAAACVRQGAVHGQLQGIVHAAGLQVSVRFPDVVSNRLCHVQST